MEGGNMRVKSLALRILNQLRHDRRTIGLMLLAPILLITLVYFILRDSTPVLNIAVVNAPAELENQLEESNISTMRCSGACGWICHILLSLVRRRERVV